LDDSVISQILEIPGRQIEAAWGIQALATIALSEVISSK
jgi:hypothetical protein